MKPNEERDIIEAVLAVRSVSPELYRNLVNALRAHALRSMQKIVLASPEHILHYQGRAREALELSETVETAAELLHKLKTGKP